MINLWYEESYWSHTGGRLSGPEKVVQNTIASLEQENIDFAINKDVHKYNFLMQYQHDEAFRKHEKLEHDTCIIGPQVWFFENNPYGRFLIDNPQYYKKVVAPSEWVQNKFVNKLNIPAEKTCIWPVGIEDLKRYDNGVGDLDCLIYFKSRPIEQLDYVKKFLDSKGIKYAVTQYGNYSEEEFRKLVGSVKFCFIIDNTESQGIAIQEMMSMNTPLLVWDVSEWDYMGEDYRVPATSVPYWSNDCGEKFKDSIELEYAFDRFYSNLDRYASRKVYESEFSYAASVKKLLDIFEK